jgi:phage-related holin
MKTEQYIGATGGLIGAIAAAAAGCWQIILVVFILYGLALFGNLGTGIFYAHQTRTYSAEKARHATYMKGGMILGILVVAVIDVMLMGLATQVGISYSVPFLACVLAGYAGTHEVTSMLENLKKLGNKVPQVLEDKVKEAGEALNQGKFPSFPDGGEPE